MLISRAALAPFCPILARLQNIGRCQHANTLHVGRIQTATWIRFRVPDCVVRPLGLLQHCGKVVHLAYMGAHMKPTNGMEYCPVDLIWPNPKQVMHGLNWKLLVHPMNASVESEIAKGRLHESLLPLFR